MVFFIFIQILMNILSANSGDPDQTSHSVASDLGFALFAYVPQKGSCLRRISPG